jgi:hypothetical protein
LGDKNMKNFKPSAFVSACLTAMLMTSTGYAAKAEYKGGAVSDGGSIAGVVTFKGDAPPPIMEDLNKGKNAEFCSQHPDTKEGGIRPRNKVVVKDGKLLNAVVFIEKINSGKKWDTKTINFDFKNCDITQKVSVIRKTPKGMKEGLITVTNHDPNTLHNPHGYSVVGASRKTLFNKPLPSQGTVADVTKNVKRLKQKKDKHFFLQCDQHNYMEADARVVWNPYYFVTGSDGSFKLDQVPAGKYQVTAWHPYIGEMTSEVTVAAGADTASNFELKAQ